MIGVRLTARSPDVLIVPETFVNGDVGGTRKTDSVVGSHIL